MPASAIPISLMMFARKGEIYFAHCLKVSISNLEYVQNYERLRGVKLLQCDPSDDVLDQFTRDVWDDVFLRLEGEVEFPESVEGMFKK